MSNNPDTWTDFNTALQASDKFSGIGFMFGGSGTYFTNKDGYSLICMGAVKATSLAASGLISTDGYIQGAYKSTSGAFGKTESVPVTMGDGSKQNLEFQDGLYVARD